MTCIHTVTLIQALWAAEVGAPAVRGVIDETREKIMLLMATAGHIGTMRARETHKAGGRREATGFVLDIRPGLHTVPGVWFQSVHNLTTGCEVDAVTVRAAL
jgi:hypothetical protein